jgi:MarR family transcriptional regulator, lower aerobic nicotinate degradation pathway regulator
MSTPATASPQRAGTAGWTLLAIRLARVAGYRVGHALEALGMRTHEFAALSYLHDAGPISQQDLGRALRVNPSNLVALLDALQADGLIVRARDPADRRRHLVGLTHAGRHRLERARKAAEDAEQQLLASLSPAERRAFVGVLERLASDACRPRSGSC